MSHQSRQRAAHTAVYVMCLAGIIVLAVSQTGNTVGGRRIIAQLRWLRRGVASRLGNDTGFGVPNATEVSSGIDGAANTSASVFDPFNERQKAAPNGRNFSFTVYPQLYKSLSRLTQPPGSVVNLTVGLPGLTACKRPAAKDLSGLLGQPNSTYPSRRPLLGGFWSPGDPAVPQADRCWPPLSRTAVLVPYRNRSQNLEQFVPYMQNLLQKQGILYGIFVIEQANTDKLFNRAKLLNIGFNVSQKFAKFDCFVFQDADKVPENVANVYDCANAPKLMISEMRPQFGSNSKRYNRGRLYNNFIGGSAAITKQMFERINGNSNRYYGWGREDDEMASRLAVRGHRIHSTTGQTGRFVNLHHSNDIVTNTMPWPYAHNVRNLMNKDGLNSLSYVDRGIYLHDLFVLIRAEV